MFGCHISGCSPIVQRLEAAMFERADHLAYL
jgi:hypothetical protein